MGLGYFDWSDGLSEDYSQGFLYGRFNPPSSHHYAMIDYVADEFELDEVMVGIVDSGETARNPMRSEQVEEALNRSFEDSDADFEFHTFVHELEGFDSLMWGDIEHISDETVFYTGDLEHALLTEARKRYCGKDIGIMYEPRQMQDFNQGYELPSSGTEVREAIKTNQGWRELMPDGTEKVIDENPEIIDAINGGNPSGPGKHLEIFFGRNQ